MRSVLLLVCCVIVAALLSGCPLKRVAQPPEPSPSGGGLVADPQPADGDIEITRPESDTDDDFTELDDPDDYVEPDTGGEFEVDLSNIPPLDEPIATSIILHFFDEEPYSPLRPHLEGTWLPYEDSLDLGPEDMPDDAIIYKKVEQDAYLEVLFGPPFSEFYIAAHLGALDDGDWEVIEIVPYDAYDGE